MASARHPLLIIDDDQASCRFMAEVLVDAGYAAEWTTDDKGAAERVRQKPYSLVVVDVTMPDVPGTEIVAEIGRSAPGLPSLLVSAFADGGARAEARRLGVPLLAKPFRAETFLATVRALIDEENEVEQAARPICVR